MAVKSLLTKRYGTRHLLFLDAQSMLILFACATMLQYLCSWKIIHIRATVVQTVFLAVAFIFYVMCRIIKNPKHRDILVFTSFASLFFYRILGDSFRTATDPVNINVSLKRMPSVASSSLKDAPAVLFTNHWVVVSVFFCTGLHLRLLFSVVLLGLIGLLLKASFLRDWIFWAVNLPLYVHFSFIGFLYYYVFYCIAVEICRLRHRPLLAIRDLPRDFFLEFEYRALNSLPLSILSKTLSREEHLYILLRITQSSAFRDAALQLIGEDPEFEASLADKDRLERAFLRTALIQFHLKQCPNRALRLLTQLVNPTVPLPNAVTRTASTGNAAQVTGAARHPTDTPRVARRSCSGESVPRTMISAVEDRLFESYPYSKRQRSRRNRRSVFAGAHADSVPKLTSMLLRHDASDHVPERAPLKALASKIAVRATRTSGAPTIMSRRSRSVARGSGRTEISAWRDSLQHIERHGNRGNTGTSSLFSSTRKRYAKETVTVGTVTFPKLDVQRAMSRARDVAASYGQRRPPRHRSRQKNVIFSDYRRINQNSSSSESDCRAFFKKILQRRCCYKKTKKNFAPQRIPAFPHHKRTKKLAVRQAAAPFTVASSRRQLQASNASFSQVFGQKWCALFDELLSNGIANPLQDPVTIQDDTRRLRTQRWHLLWCCFPLIKRALVWVGSIEAVMSKAQWRETVYVPKRTGWGSFVDTKIERWFLAWVSPVQARQHILLRTLVCIVTILNVGMVWNIYIADVLHYSYKQPDAQLIPAFVVIKQCAIYLTIRTALHLLPFIALMSLQNNRLYFGYLNSHFYKRRATLLATLGVLVSLIDTAMHQILIPGRPPTLHFVILAAVTFPIFSQLATTTHIVIGSLIIAGLFSLMPLFIRSLRSVAAALEAIVFLSLGIMMWFIFISRCILASYRMLFCRYVLPYLLYLDALQPVRAHTAWESNDEDNSESLTSDSGSNLSSNISSYTRSTVTASSISTPYK